MRRRIMLGGTIFTPLGASVAVWGAMGLLKTFLPFVSGIHGPASAEILTFPTSPTESSVTIASKLGAATRKQRRDDRWVRTWAYLTPTDGETRLSPLEPASKPYG